MDVLKPDENKTLDDEKIDEMTPLKAELNDEWWRWDGETIDF